MATLVQDNAERSRFEITVDDELVGVADYRVDGDVVVLPHTEIAPRHRGEGLAAVLVAGTLDEIRRRGQTVVPACWYVAQYIDDNPEYKDLLAS
ncbi:MAG: N-acetyltransferase [Acidimicrobiia bacterium]|nr:N-acetyltransferase [Acidimicrobiia bacterium]